jgi:hypothetical protein
MSVFPSSTAVRGRLCFQLLNAAGRFNEEMRIKSEFEQLLGKTCDASSATSRACFFADAAFFMGMAEGRNGRAVIYAN